MLAVYLGDPRADATRIDPRSATRRPPRPRSLRPNPRDQPGSRPVGRPFIAVPALQNLIVAAEQDPASGQVRAHG